MCATHTDLGSFITTNTSLRVQVPDILCQLCIPLIYVGTCSKTNVLTCPSKTFVRPNDLPCFPHKMALHPEVYFPNHIDPLGSYDIPGIYLRVLLVEAPAVQGR